MPWASIVLAVIAISLAWTAYTQHAWEDFYITFRASKNLATGHGLTFTAGEPVHSFTSPLGVLLPALASWLTGNSSDAAALWIFRVMGIAALAGAAVLLFAAIRRLGGSLLAAWLGLGCLMLESKTVDYTTNGMETGFLLLFLAYAFWSFLDDSPRRWRHLGLAWAGLMWSRPDSFIYIGLFAFGYAVFRIFGRGSARWDFAPLFLKAGLVCTVIYLPWLIWAWSYYGSPIPHTIVAKGSMGDVKTVRGVFEAFIMMPIRMWSGGTTIENAFMPSYFQRAAWPVAFVYTSRVVGAICAFVWIWPTVRPEVRSASLTFHGAHTYLTYFPYFPFPWYFPATALLGAVVIGGLAAQLLAAGRKGGPRLSRVVSGVALATIAWLLVVQTCVIARSAERMAAQQKYIYEGNLRRIGEWLARNARATDRVFMEPLGYIGYFSRLRTYDFPGLSSPRMVASRKRVGNAWSQIISDLLPEWLVLRESEMRQVTNEMHDLLSKTYEPVKSFDVSGEVSAVPVRDHLILDFDSKFTVFRRKGPALDEDMISGIQTLVGTDAPMLTVEGVKMRVAHAPSTIGLRVPASATHLSITFGYVTEAYTSEPKTDGAEFTVYWVDGTEKQTLFSRRIDPAREPADRGVLSFAGDLPLSKTGHAKLLLHASSGGSTTKDWTCWGGPEFR